MLTESIIAVSIIGGESVEPTFGPYGREKIMAVHYLKAFSFWSYATVGLIPFVLVSYWITSGTLPSLSMASIMFAVGVFSSMALSYLSAAMTASDYSEWVKKYYGKNPQDWNKWDAVVECTE